MPINSVFEMLIGNRETIRRGAVSGSVSGLCITIVFAVYLYFAQFKIDLEGLPFLRGFEFGFWYPVICLTIGFVVVGGRAIGWLLIRPIATVLRATFPQLDLKTVWIFSTIFVWVTLAWLALNEYQRTSPILQAVLLIGAIAAGAAGGTLGAKAATNKKAKDWRELLVTGGTVTGSSLIGLVTLIDLIVSRSANMTNLSSGVIGFFLSLSLISFLALLPYFIIEPLSVGLFKLNPFPMELHMAYMLMSGTVWTMLAFFFFGVNTLSDGVFFERILYVIAIGLCGAFGGWAIGQLKADV